MTPYSNRISLRQIFKIMFILIWTNSSIYSQSTLLIPGGGFFENNSQTNSISIPSLTTQQLNSYPNPKKGMMIYDLESRCIKFYNGIDWNCLSSTSNNSLISCGDCNYNSPTNSFEFNGIDSESDSSGTFIVYTELVSFPTTFPFFLSSRIAKLNSNNSGFDWNNPIIVTYADPQLKTYRVILTKTSIYVIASFCGLITIVNGDDVQPIGQSDSMVFKFDKNGNRKWFKLFGGTLQDIPLAITSDAAENIYVGGWFNSPSISAGSFTIQNTNSNSNTKDAFLIKIDSSGNILNLKGYGGLGDDEIKTIANNPVTNELLISGYFSGNATFCSQNLTSTGSKDLFITQSAYNLSCNSTKKLGGINPDDELIPVDIDFNQSYSQFRLCTNAKGTFNLQSYPISKATGFIFSADYLHPDIPLNLTILKNGSFSYFKKNYGIINYSNDFALNSVDIRNNSNNKTTIFKIDNDCNLLWYKNGGNNNSNGRTLAYYGQNLNIFGNLMKESNFCGKQLSGISATNPLFPNFIIDKTLLFGVQITD